uniref:Putative secreted protein n=1 Tax=Ixodes ricinus TaxID=34613 RepID=A0A6B0UUQ6_IXORI
MLCIHGYLLHRLLQWVHVPATVALTPKFMPIVNGRTQGVHGGVGKQGKAFLARKKLAFVQLDGFGWRHSVVEIAEERPLCLRQGSETTKCVCRLCAVRVLLVMAQLDHCRQRNVSSKEQWVRPPCVAVYCLNLYVDLGRTVHPRLRG